MRNKIYLILILLITTMSLFAQRGPFDKTINKDRRDKMEQLRIWKMTEFLDLTTDQATEFFPLIRQHEKKILKFHNQQREIMQEINDKINNENYKPTEQEVNLIIDKIGNTERKILKERSIFLKSLNKVLTKEQQLRVIVFESRFKRHLMRALSNREDFNPKINKRRK